MKSLLALTCFLLLVAQAYADDPPKIDGMAGVSFGASVDEVKSAMDARGAVFHPEVSTSVLSEFRGGAFSSEHIKYWRFYFEEGKLYRTSINIDPQGSEHIPTYERFKKLLSDKYGQPAQETKIEMDHHQLYGLVHSGKTVLEANWREVTPTSRSITCKMFKSGDMVLVRIVYQDDMVGAQVADRLKGDL